MVAVRVALGVGLVLVLALVPPNTSAETLVPSGIHGAAAATTITVDKYGGSSFQGGLYRQNLVCEDCLVRVTIASGNVQVVQDGNTVILTPGAYEFREFRGTVHYTRVALHDYDVQFEGTGVVYAL